MPSQPPPSSSPDVRSIARPASRAYPEAPQDDPAQAYERIACRACGRWFTTTDGPEMLAMIVGPCPDCGGMFELLGGDPGHPHAECSPDPPHR